MRPRLSYRALCVNEAPCLEAIALSFRGGRSSIFRSLASSNTGLHYAPDGTGMDVNYNHDMLFMKLDLLRFGMLHNNERKICSSSTHKTWSKYVKTAFAHEINTYVDIYCTLCFEEIWIQAWWFIQNFQIVAKTIFFLTLRLKFEYNDKKYLGLLMAIL